MEMSTAYADQMRLHFTTAHSADFPYRLHGITGEEQISRFFKYRLELHAPASVTVDPATILGQQATVRIEHAGRPARLLHGVIAQVERVGRDERHTFIEAVLVPPHVTLHHRRGYQIHEKMTLRNIIAKECEGLPIRIDFHEAIHPHRYSVRYAESPWNYLSRLLEEEGRYCYFEQGDDQCVLVFADTSARATLPPECAALPLQRSFNPSSITSFRRRRQLVPWRGHVWDHHHQAPDLPLSRESTLPPDVACGRERLPLRPPVLNDRVDSAPMELAQRFSATTTSGVADRAGLDGMTEERDRLANVHLQRQASTAISVSGTSPCPSIEVGRLLQLTEAGPDSGEYFVTSLSRSVRIGIKGRDDWETKAYECRFEGLPKELVYRTPRRTPRPCIRGVLTAIVASDIDREIATTDDASVKVTFRWDRRSDPQSCWIRVMRPLAGTGYGMVSIPRKGQEVLIAFRDGDPDQPIVLGSTYNALQPPPENADTLRHREGQWHRSLSGGPEHASQWTVDTKLGSERATLYGQRDSKAASENDHRIVAGNDMTLHVGRSVSSDPSPAEASTSESDVVATTPQPTDEGDSSPATTSPPGNYELVVTGTSSQTVGGDLHKTIHGPLILNQAGSQFSTFEFPQRFVSSGPVNVASAVSHTAAHAASGEICFPVGRLDVGPFLNVRLSASIWRRDRLMCVDVRNYGLENMYTANNWTLTGSRNVNRNISLDTDSTVTTLDTSETSSDGSRSEQSSLSLHSGPSYQV
ncbi:Phage-related baseplate assembly protein [Planctomycetes bacterium Pan216]|uniref:Phage-related baseplate assembly protein n=1 Tax=Kolteria novifilia TaxID=2527975 RepID=A0A518AYV3_9BACT|nr:Phage-related baseplate assembly protein [Planctomycetes bacterium Pan216]